MKTLIDKLEKNRILTNEELVTLILNRNQKLAQYLFDKADAVRRRIYGNDIFIRGLIELTNYCKNDCFYCGIRKSNRNAARYRLTGEQVLSCCETGYETGFRTFVLQGGEDRYFTDNRLCDLIASIKSRYPDCALTLSVGEKSFASYQAYYSAGADRYLLRHETANEAHYKKLHPASMSLPARKQCLYDLKEIGFQAGCGFMVGSPYQTAECLAEDLLYIRELEPEMVGIGPYIPHHDTPFAREPGGTIEMTLFMLGVVRLMLPNVLLPATTALATIHPQGRELGILAGANVIMPNLSPVDVRKKYLLYDNKIFTGDEAAEGFENLKKNMEKIGYSIIIDRGDCKPMID
ncbi:MAG TPA: [FeFe] hydrogenase H-cluster radical SAM maturase HydE [Syntrophomonadaceae bacterium]|nr:[FeFe] hydrogenase H-cluster radical SAM maturase HydE [Syntrophomonadaceae bacterium]HPR94292.1 [FeFe] hydrogenase H-cluster radical SAM maturase HydE [Syntrophomonadaceae bacterium]